LGAYLDGEVHGGGGRQTTDADAGDVLGNGRLLEGSGVGSAGGGVDHGGQGAGAVLVDLVEGHGDGAIVAGGGETRRGTRASCGSDTSFLGALCGLGSSSAGAASSSSTGTAGTTTGKSVEEATLGTSGSTRSTSSAASTAHEGRDGSSSVDGTATLGTAKSGSLTTHLLGADDGSIGLRTGEGVARVTGSTVDDGESGHGDTVGALNRGDHTVGRDGAGKSSGSEGDGVTHFDELVDKT
jgi:hypothetical protein